MDAKRGGEQGQSKARGFNPRARDGRENRNYYDPADYKVSIHAPVMDANLIKPQS